MPLGDNQSKDIPYLTHHIGVTVYVPSDQELQVTRTPISVYIDGTLVEVTLTHYNGAELLFEFDINLLS